MLPRILFLGRPNVGKSSLFNIFSGHKIAIVSETEHTTRDVVEYRIDDSMRGVSYTIADAGGWDIEGNDPLIIAVREQVEDHLARADIVLFVVEHDHLTETDDRIARLLRKSGKIVFLLANKADNSVKEREALECVRLGFGDVYPVSASHNRGMEAVRDAIAEHLQNKGFGYVEASDDTDTIRLAIIGRPNVGKSSIINAITGMKRAIVSDVSGTTRDSFDTDVDYGGRTITLIDTAGIRRAGKIGIRNIEHYSVLRSERALDRADIVAVVTDATEGITHQDLAILGRAADEHKGIILVVNKWDAYLKGPQVDPNHATELYMQYLKRHLEFLPYVTPLFTSAVDGKRITDILDTATHIHAERTKRITTAVFNRFLSQIVLDHPPTGSKKSHKPKLYYGSQVDVLPPKFVLSVNNAAHFHFSYPRYIENRLRETFGFYGTPVVIELKSRESIYGKKAIEKRKLAKDLLSVKNSGTKDTI